jgi:hypothetical protein
VNQLAAIVNKLVNDRNALDSKRPANAELLLWFHKNPENAKKHFGVLV